METVPSLLTAFTWICALISFFWLAQALDEKTNLTIRTPVQYMVAFLIWGLFIHVASNAFFTDVYGSHYIKNAIPLVYAVTGVSKAKLYFIAGGFALIISPLVLALNWNDRVGGSKISVEKIFSLISTLLGLYINVKEVFPHLFGQ